MSGVFEAMERREYGRLAGLAHSGAGLAAGGRQPFSVSLVYPALLHAIRMEAVAPRPATLAQTALATEPAALALDELFEQVAHFFSCLALSGSIAVESVCSGPLRFRPCVSQSSRKPFWIIVMIFF